jgi:hypothetical protein
MMDQGYSREAAESHPSNAINVFKREVAAKKAKHPSPRALREGARLVVGAGGVVMTAEELTDAQDLHK